MGKATILLIAAASKSVFCAGLSLIGQGAAPGSSVLLPLTLDATDGAVGALQFDIDYDSSVISLAATLGDSSRGSEKSLLSADITPQKKRFLVMGWNENIIGSGVLINLFVNLKSDLPGGVYNLQFSDPTGADPFGVLSSLTGAGAAITIDSTSDESVRLLPTGVLNAASEFAGPVAPGEIITLIGSGIGPASTVQPGGNTIAAGFTVVFDGTLAPILYAGPNEIHAIVPYAVSGNVTNLQVSGTGGTLAAQPLTVAPAAPGIFTVNGSGVGQGAILNQDSSLNSPLNPATAGSVVVIYATGAGGTNPPGADGAVAGTAIIIPILPISVEVGELEAEVLYAGSAPGLISGVLQVNCRVPVVPSGPAVPVRLKVGDWVSPSGTTIAVQ